MNMPYIVKVGHPDHGVETIASFTWLADAKQYVHSLYETFNAGWEKYEYDHDVKGLDVHLYEYLPANFPVGESCMAYIESEKTGVHYLALAINEWEISR